jgi:uncharacterized membrane protein (DUF2068 family)
MTAHPDARRRAIRAIAVFEAVKGLAALIASLGVLGLMHRDVHELALALLWRFHLDPDLHFPALLMHYADLLQTIKLRSLAPAALAYISLRWLEAYGLWYDKTWAEWLAALSGAFYIPFEIAHLMHRTTLISAGVLLGNVGVVGFMAWQLWRRRHPAAPVTV